MRRLARLGYNIFFVIGFFAAAPYYGYRLWRRGQALNRFGERLGFYDTSVRERLKDGTDLWIHAVSVGEIMIVKSVLAELRKMLPHVEVVVTTTTQTGRRIADELEDDKTTVLYNPIDWYFPVEAAFNLIRPKRLVLIEAEIWPNYLWAARQRNVPVYLANARLSERTEFRYRKLRWIVRPLLGELDLVLAQDALDIERLTGAGFPAESIFLTGSLKYDVATGNIELNESVETWWSRCGWPQERQVLLAASTHAGEEEIFLSVLQELKADFPQLRLLLAPRHAERGRSILEMCRRRGLEAASRTAETAWRSPGDPAIREPEVIVSDTTGELKYLYAKASIAFVGKSLRSRGGQNFLESVRLATPTLVGPNMQNFAVITRDFVRQKGILQVSDEAELVQVIRELLENPKRRRQLGEKGHDVFCLGLGAAKRTAEVLRDSLNHLERQAPEIFA